MIRAIIIPWTRYSAPYNNFLMTRYRKTISVLWRAAAASASAIYTSYFTFKFLVIYDVNDRVKNTVQKVNRFKHIVEKELYVIHSRHYTGF